jgi:hypothetical protein
MPISAVEPNRFLRNAKCGTRDFCRLQTVKRCQPYVPIFLGRQCSVFGNMANKNNGDIGFFGEFNQFCRGFRIWDILRSIRYNRYEGFESNQ